MLHFITEIHCLGFLTMSNYQVTGSIMFKVQVDFSSLYIHSRYILYYVFIYKKSFKTVENSKCNVPVQTKREHIPYIFSQNVITFQLLLQLKYIKSILVQRQEGFFCFALFFYVTHHTQTRIKQASVNHRSAQQTSLFLGFSRGRYDTNSFR